jgi:TctA family transporter
VTDEQLEELQAVLPDLLKKLLATAAIGSFFAGCVSTLLIAVASPPLARIGLSFQAPDYFSLMVLGLTLSTFLGSGSMIKALLMVALGVVLGCVGTDPISGTPRLTYGAKALLDGLDMVPVVMGLFGISEVLLNLEQMGQRIILTTKIRHLLPTKEDWRMSLKPIAAAVKATMAHVAEREGVTLRISSGIPKASGLGSSSAVAVAAVAANTTSRSSRSSRTFPARTRATRSSPSSS